MTFDWPQYLAVAREMIARADPPELAEARARAAVSRAYYAAFGAALRWCSAAGEYDPSRRGDDHGGLVACLRGQRERRRFQIGEILERLRRARRWADCDRGPTREGCAYPGVAIAQAERVLSLLAALDGPG